MHTEAQRVRLTGRDHHPGGHQRLAQRVDVSVRQGHAHGHVATARGVGKRAGQFDPQMPALLLKQADQGIGQRLVLAIKHAHVGRAPEFRGRAESGIGQHRGGAHQMARHAWCREVIGGEVEGGRMPHPATQRRPGGILPARMHVQECRRAGPAAQVLVAARHREIRVRGVKVDRHRAGRMRQIPQRQGAVRMRQRRHRLHVEPRTAAIVDM